MKMIFNYIGQIRIYSFIDLVVFATALTRSWGSIFGISLLWISFLLYLEAMHKDDLRLMIKKYVWAGPFVASFLFLPAWLPPVFFLFSFLYAKKKEGRLFGLTAPVWRGLQNGIIASAFNPALAPWAFGLTFIRNLVGDFRDSGYDYHKGMQTVPVALGFHQNQLWAFYGHALLVVCTTIVWLHYSFLSPAFLLPVIFVELLSYPITPRASSPKYFNFYA